jgi:hypothetical protein
MLFVLSHLLSKENLFGSSKDGIELLFVDRVEEVVLMSAKCTSTITLEEINAFPRLRAQRESFTKRNFW